MHLGCYFSWQDFHCFVLCGNVQKQKKHCRHFQLILQQHTPISFSLAFLSQRFLQIWYL